jgi:hypothetical protein
MLNAHSAAGGWRLWGGAPIIGVIAHEPNGRAPHLPRQCPGVLVPPKDVGHDSSGAVIERLPQPPLVLLLPHDGLQLSPCRFVRSRDTRLCSQGIRHEPDL